MESTNPERMFESDPLSGLIDQFRTSFKVAFSLRSDQERSASNHPSNQNRDFYNGRFIKRDSISIKDVSCYKIMMKLPEPDPAVSFDNTEEIADVIEMRNTTSSLQNTRFMVYMASSGEFDLPNINITQINELLSKVDQFIVEIVQDDEKERTIYVVERNGIWPLIVDDNSSVDIEKEFIEMLEAEADFTDDIVARINYQSELAEKWLKLFKQMNLLAYQ